MYRVNRRNPGEEMSAFLRGPKTGWVTSQSTKRLSWMIHDLTDFKKNSYYIGIRHRLMGACPDKLVEMEVGGEEEDEEAKEEDELDKETEQRAEDVDSLEHLVRQQFYTVWLLKVLRAQRVRGMTADDLPTVLQRR